MIKSVKLKVRFILCISLIYLYWDIAEIKSLKPIIRCLLYIFLIYLYTEINSAKLKMKIYESNIFIQR